MSSIKTVQKPVQKPVQKLELFPVPIFSPKVCAEKKAHENLIYNHGDRVYVQDSTGTVVGHMTFDCNPYAPQNQYWCGYIYLAGTKWEKYSNSQDTGELDHIEFGRERGLYEKLNRPTLANRLKMIGKYGSLSKFPLSKIPWITFLELGRLGWDHDHYSAMRPPPYVPFEVVLNEVKLMADLARSIQL